MEKGVAGMKKPYALIIVDDLDIACLDFRQTLDGSGYLTELVLHGQINVEEIARSQPNIIFAHYSLAGISGVEIIEAIRADKRLKQIPVVGLATYKEVANDLSAHVDTVLLRPVDVERLNKLLSLFSSNNLTLDKNPWDALTGLYSPVFFMARLQHVLKQSKRTEDHRFMVFSINLDQLIRYEKKFGKEYRQQILQGVAKVLRKILRPSDVVARFEADHFLVLIEDAVDRFAPASIADRMQLEFDEYLVSIGLKNRVKINIGGIYCTVEYKTADEVLRDVQFALYLSKRDKRTRFKVYDRKTLPAQPKGVRSLVGV